MKGTVENQITGRGDVETFADRNEKDQYAIVGLGGG